MTQQSHCWAYTPRKSMSKFYWLLLQDLQNLATYHCSTWSKPSSFLLWIIGMVFRLPPLPPTACFQYGSIVDQPKPAHTPLQCPPLSKVLAVIFQGPQSLAHYPSGLIAVLCFALCHFPESETLPCPGSLHLLALCLCSCSECHSSRHCHDLLPHLLQVFPQALPSWGILPDYLMKPRLLHSTSPLQPGPLPRLKLSM